MNLNLHWKFETDKILFLKLYMRESNSEHILNGIYLAFVSTILECCSIEVNMYWLLQHTF